MSGGMVYIVILNWNGWRDTVECLESVMRLDYPDFRVLVCDNGSTDDSLARIRAWAAGQLAVGGDENHPLYGLSHPPVAKPIAMVEYDRVTAEAGGGDDGSARIALISTGGNLGFAGGNNVAMRYALARGDFSHVWLLNNDTVVEKDALSRLVQRLAERPDAGICGSMLPYYDEPGTIWTAGGGTFNRWLAKSCSIDDRRPLAAASEPWAVEGQMDYVAGASMLVTKRFLEEVGLMGEEYFLYFEEPDWISRARGRFALAYAEGSIVYHKVGISTGRRDEGPDRTAESYYFRAQLLFTAKFFPVALPLVLGRVIVNRCKSAIRRWRRSRC